MLFRQLSLSGNAIPVFDKVLFEDVESCSEAFSDALESQCEGDVKGADAPSVPPTYPLHEKAAPFKGILPVTLQNMKCIIFNKDNRFSNLGKLLVVILTLIEDFEALFSEVRGGELHWITRGDGTEHLAEFQMGEPNGISSLTDLDRS